MTQQQREEEYNLIDITRVKGILQAERQCRSLKMGGLDWTPELAQIFTELQFWTKAIKHRRGRRIDTRHLRQLAKQSGDPIFWLMSEEEKLANPWTFFIVAMYHLPLPFFMWLETTQCSSWVARSDYPSIQQYVEKRRTRRAVI